MEGQGGEANWKGKRKRVKETGEVERKREGNKNIETRSGDKNGDKNKL